MIEAIESGAEWRVCVWRLAADVPCNTTALVTDCIMFEEFVIVCPTSALLGPYLLKRATQQEQR